MIEPRPVANDGGPYRSERTEIVLTKDELGIPLGLEPGIVSGSADVDAVLVGVQDVALRAANPALLPSRAARADGGSRLAGDG